MAKSRINFNGAALKKAVNDGVSKMASDLTRQLNALTAQYEGRPVDEVKPAVQDVWRRGTGGTITDPELTQFAEQIAAGGQITVRLEK